MERGINPKPERKGKQTNLVIFQISDNGRGVNEKEEIHMTCEHSI